MYRSLTDLFASHLAGMIKCPTVSSPDPEKIKTEDFFALHTCLEETYPLVHRTLQKEVIGKCALLYRWKGTDPSLPPMMLMAHQDVVPEGDVSAWKYPPFSGRIDEDGVLWGRGATDSKCNIEAYMDAVEILLSEGFTPAADLYLAFGYNEEIMGGPGAAGQILHDELLSRGLDFGLIMDECGGILEKEDGRYVAEIFISEKGYADHEFYVDDEGGHSAYPPLHTAVGTLGKAIYELEEKRMKPFLSAPVREEMLARAPYAEPLYATLFADPDGNRGKLCALAETDRTFNQMMRTTTAPTMSAGSRQANILPEHASVIANSRILPGQTLDDLEAHFRASVPDDVHFRLVKGHNPPAVSSTGSYGYRVIQAVAEEMYPGIHFIPSMMAGGTDSRYFSDLSSDKSVYRFTGIRQSPRTGGAHQVNEHIDTAVLAKNVEFYVRLLREYGH